MNCFNFIKKDIFSAFENNEIDVIAHQANCLGNMRGGIARLIAGLYPEIETLDKNYCIGNEKLSVFGTNLDVKVDKGIIVNMYSQLYLGTCGHVHSKDSFVNRNAMLRKCLASLKEKYSNSHLIGIPLIASGLAKDKSKGVNDDLTYFKEYVLPIIETVFYNTTLNIYYL